MKFLCDVFANSDEPCDQVLFQGTLLVKFERIGCGFEEGVVSVGEGFLQDFAFESGGERSGAKEFGGKEVHEFKVFPSDLRSEVVEMFFFEFGFGFFDRSGGTVLHGAFGLFAIMFSFDMGIECGIGEILFPTSTDKIPAFDIFSGATTGLGGFELLLVFEFIWERLDFLLWERKLLFSDRSRIHDIMRN